MEKGNNFEIFVKVYFPIIIVVIVLAFSILIAGNMNLRRELKQERQEKEIIDTTYNHKTLDSIEYNIIKRDTIIYNYKKELAYEIEKSITLNDSDAVKLFYQLVTDK